ncbi:2,3-dihydroxybenzoate-AMP ligase [Streptoalloteichus tenebrarius]|uniref:2,3-dihydroxybenzoate-AMP ligase n=1 Tax=Streptoalloteichus tenebrarius (strain ATCC 17920 / DSM 40477 / JCM 4838 / CBS 697.72 / NBRC 16177 / NCIMB 11028 / NRRL B-12390 / A12253. 1 / ISP 5477) TaxID=1933 RepID=A0ABT1I0D1_STRSD|nr:(2,3-dihydroxybenzoyl)adenylate synthase [Streptoalloteichus tenebrarius]MCP2261203.1 2,3-dihydroxybenzoate-AMP ligase [Streptoalloteichus tenebrarius]
MGWPEEVAARYRELGLWQGQTFGAMLRERAALHADRIAVVCGDRRWTYAELDARADRVAAGLLRLGVAPGERVVVQLPNIAEFLEVVFGVWRAGALPVFALPAHRSAEITYFCEFTEAAAYVIADRHGGFDYRALASEVRRKVPGLRHVLVVGDPGEHTALDEVRVPESERDAAVADLPEVDASEVAFFQLSGGSTGVPKLIPRTHDDYLFSVRESARICGLTPESVYLCVLPAAHNYPLSSPGSLGTLWAGGRVVMCPQPSPDVAFALVERERVTITGVVPPLALVWMQAAPNTAHDLSSLEVLQVGGAKFSAEAARRVTPVLGCRLQQVFGMAEGLVNYTRLDDPEEIVVTTQGRPISEHDEVLVVDDDDRPVPVGVEGHLLTRGPYTIRGYYRAPEHNRRSFTPDGFYRTGDVVSLTPEGYLVVEGRAKDQINRGGEKVAAEEVENHLLAHPGVRDVAVVGMPDEYLGERTCAFVIPGDPAPRAVELTRFLRGRGLAAFKIPDRVEFVESFPETGVGKVSKKELRALIANTVRSTHVRKDS